MGIFAKIAGAFSTKSASVPLFSNIGQQVGTFGMTNRSNAEYYRGWVFRCVSSIKDEIAKIDISLETQDKQGNIEVIHQHPALKLLHYVNPFFTKYTLFERVQADLELFGNHYWLLEKDSKGQPVEIYPLMPHLVRPVVDATAYIKYYEYTVDGKTWPIPVDNILHFKNYNPQSFIVGLSTIEAVRVSVDTDEAAKAYNRQFFKNNATPGIILEYPGNISAYTMAMLRQQWDEQHRGQAARTAIAAGGLKVHQMEYKQSDMQFIEQRKFSRDEIFALFGVSPTIAGVNDATVYAAAKAAEYTFASRTIEPKMVRIIDTLNEFLLPLFKDTDGMLFRFKSPVPLDLATQTAYYQSGINNGYLSPNDVRRMQQLPELKDGEQVFMPSSLIAFSEPAQKEIRETPAQKERGAVIKSMVSGAVKAIKDAELIAGKWTAKEFDTMGEAKVKARNSRTPKYEKLFIKTSAKLFEEQKARVLASLDDAESLKMPFELKFNVKDVFDEEYEIGLTIDLFAPLFKKVTDEEGKLAMEAVGLKPGDFDIDTPSMQEFLKKNTKLFAGAITQTTSDGIRAVIVDGLEAGEAIVGIRKRIEEYSGFDRARSEMIARTETIRAQGEAEVAAWKESNVVESTAWYTALDERVCPDCGAVHGTKVDLGAEFLSVAELQNMDIQPYDGGVGAPPLHPQCRCVLIPVVK